MKNKGYYASKTRMEKYISRDTKVINTMGMWWL
jgi:hypothetical protein